jgi:ribosomal protein S16
MKYNYSKDKAKEVLKKYAEGGSLGNHGLKEGDQIIKTMSGGVQKVKTKTGDIVYVNLANGYRGAEPPLPFAKGGGVRKVGNREYSTGRNWTNDHRHVNKSEQHEVNYNRRNSLFFATGGVTKNYVQRKQLNTITIKKGDQKLTYKVSDVYNGAYKLEDGGKLEKLAFYVPKRNVVKVQLRDGKDVKVANGYWIKKGAKPIHTSKYDDGGITEKEFIKKEIDSQKELEKGKVFKKYRVNVYEDSFPFVEPLMTDNLVEAVNFIKKTIEEQRKYRASSKEMFAEISEFIPIEKRDNVRYAYKRVGVLSEEDLKSSKYDDGGQLEMEYAGGGKIETKIQKKVDEVNSLIEKAIDKDGDPIMVVDKSGTWEEPMQYKPIVYKNGRLYFEYYEPYSGKTKKEVVNKSNIEFDGYPMLLDIAKMYRSALKQKGISFADGGKTTFKQKATAIAKNFEGKKVEPKYQKEYGKTYDKAEAKEVGNKIAGSQKAKYDSKMKKGGGVKKTGGAMQLAKQIRKDGESWQSALKRANEQVRNK